MSIKVKEALVSKSAFLFLPSNLLSEPVIMSEIAYQMVTKDMIYKAFMI